MTEERSLEHLYQEGMASTFRAKTRWRVGRNCNECCLKSCGYRNDIRKVTPFGTGEVAPKLRALAVLPQTIVWFPAPTPQLTTICNSNSREFNLLFLPLCVQRYTSRQNSHRHKINIERTFLLGIQYQHLPRAQLKRLLQKLVRLKPRHVHMGI